jgi:hypothetical protein
MFDLALPLSGGSIVSPQKGVNMNRLNWVVLGLAGFLSVNCFASETIRGSVSVHTLRCEIRAGHGPVEERKATLLAGTLQEPHLGIMHQEPQTIELEHQVGQLAGCEMEKLDQIVEESGNNFGFRLDIPITVTKTLGQPFLGFDGQCRAWFEETLNIDLGLGIVLTSEAQEIRAQSAKSCAF